MKKIIISLFLISLFNFAMAAGDDPVALQEACDSGDADNCFALGGIYNFGIGVDKDLTKAFRVFTRACNANHIQGCYQLGTMYANGKGTTANKEKALELFEKACDGGSKKACTDREQVAVINK